MEILCVSVNFDNEGPDGIELGKVKTRVMTANMATQPRSWATRRGGIRGMGLPNNVRWTGIVEVQQRT